MVSLETLTINGYLNEPVPHTFLNIENNVSQSIQALERVMRAIETFLAGRGKAEK